MFQNLYIPPLKSGPPESRLKRLLPKGRGSCYNIEEEKLQVALG